MNCKVVYIWTTLVYFIIRIPCMQHVNHKKAAIIFNALSKIIIKRREELNKSQRILADEFGFTPFKAATEEVRKYLKSIGVTH